MLQEYKTSWSKKLEESSRRQKTLEGCSEEGQGSHWAVGPCMMMMMMMMMEEKMEITGCEVQAIGWMIEHLPAEILQEMC